MLFFFMGRPCGVHFFAAGWLPYHYGILLTDLDSHGRVQARKVHQN
ncbi:hypothetical protein RMSM_03500 [Rhodopirellula maiorica SM1]|uniref:Uncharacterized protein n=1 Tax=Rhodopirellula maiorica SM1 TaxID=1265738 RepID=M5S075_9BACT|nr:hypothetical protein [Rhodopirellula maiorica]EMI19574.1 hypothetical protein RMSM_03500 [Rhodopirellula maiorica SM1]